MNIKLPIDVIWNACETAIEDCDREWIIDCRHAIADYNRTRHKRAKFLDKFKHIPEINFEEGADLISKGVIEVYDSTYFIRRFSNELKYACEVALNSNGHITLSHDDFNRLKEYFK